MSPSGRLLKIVAGFLFVVATNHACSQNPSPCTSPEYRQFDFWIGDWDVFESGSTASTARVRVDRVLGGCVPASGIDNLGCYPAQHLEGSYIPRDSLNRADHVGAPPLWYIDNGSTVLERSLHDNNWHVRWILRERAINLFGPDPKTLVHPVLPEALLSEMLVSVEKLRSDFVAEIC